MIFIDDINKNITTAIQLRHYTDAQMDAKLEALFHSGMAK